jgi:hypothetical protein
VAVFAGFVSEFIPAIGTYIGAATPILLTLAFQGLVAGVVVLGYALVYQQAENYWLSPRISTGTMSLNGGVAFGAALAGWCDRWTHRGLRGPTGRRADHRCDRQLRQDLRRRVPIRARHRRTRADADDGRGASQ